MEAGDTFGRPQGLTTVCRAVPSGVMLGFVERHLFTSSTSQQHLGTITAGAAELLGGNLECGQQDGSRV
ncbi:hypothetical protein R3I93_019354 [Phoxinus phoxinus]|uniref:Uncharacterized protein n=1 Tax=Phoxinus phoxinus TaxID=58324 RepID=A0AAN9GU23_9TELE